MGSYDDQLEELAGLYKALLEPSVKEEKNMKPEKVLQAIKTIEDLYRGEEDRGKGQYPLRVGDHFLSWFKGLVEEFQTIGLIGTDMAKRDKEGGNMKKRFTKDDLVPGLHVVETGDAPDCRYIVLYGGILLAIDTKSWRNLDDYDSDLKSQSREYDINKVYEITKKNCRFYIHHKDYLKLVYDRDTADKESELDAIKEEISIAQLALEAAQNKLNKIESV